MKAQIISVEEIADGGVRVEVESEYGRFPAAWSGPAPAVGATVEVEVGFGETFTWDGDIVAVDDPPHGIGVDEGGSLVLVATLERSDEDGFVALRLGSSLLLVETEGSAPEVGTRVQLNTWIGVTLSDTGI